MAMDGGNLGPCMAALRAQQQSFVLALIDQVEVNYTRAYLTAYPKAGFDTAKVNGHRLAHDERILQAIHEESQRRIRAGVVVGLNSVIAIATNPTHKDQLKASLALLNRGGLHEMTEHKVTVERPTDDVEIAKSVVSLAKELGLDPVKLLGKNAPLVGLLPPPVDAEFVLIENEGIGTAEGLEDVL